MRGRERQAKARKMRGVRDSDNNGRRERRKDTENRAERQQWGEEGGTKQTEL